MNDFLQAFIGRRKVTSLFLNSSNILSGMAANIWKLQRFLIWNLGMMSRIFSTDKQLRELMTSLSFFQYLICSFIVGNKTFNGLTGLKVLHLEHNLISR